MCVAWSETPEDTFSHGVAHFENMASRAKNNVILTSNKSMCFLSITYRLLFTSITACSYAIITSCKHDFLMYQPFRDEFKPSNLKLEMSNSSLEAQQMYHHNLFITLFFESQQISVDKTIKCIGYTGKGVLDSNLGSQQ